MTTAYTSLLGLALPVTGELSGTWGDVVNNSITSLLDSAIAGTTTISADADVTLSTTTGAANTAREAILLWTANGTVTRNITAPAQSKIYTVINASAGTQSIVLRGAGPTTGVTILKGESALCAWNGSDFIKISNTAGAGTFTSLTVSGTTALNGNTTIGDAAADSLTVNATIGSNLIFTDNTYDIGASGATRPRTLYLGTSLITPSITNSGLTSGRVVYTTTGGLETASANLTFDGTTLTANALTTTSTVTINGGTANGVAYLNGSKVLTTGSALTFDGTNLGIGTSSPAYKLDVNIASGSVRVRSNTATANSAGYLLGNSFRAWSMLSESGAGNFIISDETTAGTPTRLTIDSSGNLGLGVTPSAWYSTFRAFELPNGTALWNNGGNNTLLGSNVYVNAGATNTYKASDYATQYLQGSGAHKWYTAASGTAGAPIAFTQAMTLDASGNLGVGTTSITASAKLELAGGNLRVRNTNNTASSNTTFWNGDYVGAFLWNQSNTSGAVAGIQFVNGSSANGNAGIGGVAEAGTPTTSALAFYTGGSGVGGGTVPERARIDSAGNLGLGVTPSAWGGGYKAIDLNTYAGISATTADFRIVANAYYNGTSWIAKTTSASTGYVSTGGSQFWQTAPSVTAGTAVTFSNAMTLDASGNLGVGTTSPGGRLHVYGSTGSLFVKTSGTTIADFSNTANGSPNITITGSGTTYSPFIGIATNDLTFGTSNTERARIDSSGNLLVGTTTAGQKATVNGAIQVTGNSTNFNTTGAQIDSYGGMRLCSYISTGSALQFLTNPNGGNTAEVGRFDSSGNLLVGKTNASASNAGIYLAPSGSSSSAMAGTGTNIHWIFVNNAGVTPATVGYISSSGSTTSYVTSSDYRLKENISPMTGALATVAALKPCTYTWSADGSNGQGFIAHELQAVVPDAVVGEKDAVNEDGSIKAQGIDTSFLVATLTAAIQEQQAIIESLKARLDAANL